MSSQQIQDSSAHPPGSERPVHPLEQRPAPLPSKPALTVEPHRLKVDAPQSTPVLTYVLLGANVLVFMLDWLTEVLGLGYHGIGLLSLWGMKSNEAIIGGQYWRLLTPMFLHVGIVHLAFNSYALYVLGPRVERAFGNARFAAVYILSGISGAIASFAFSRDPSVGASGALFGLTGVLLPFLYHNRGVIVNARSWMTGLVQTIVVNLLIGLTPGIDNWGHIGGLLAGLILGWVIAPRYVARDPVANVVRLEDRTSQSVVWLSVGMFAIALGALTAFLLSLKG